MASLLLLNVFMGLAVSHGVGEDFFFAMVMVLPE
jgi:hypothetical protein